MKINGPSVSDIADEELLRRAVANARDPRYRKGVLHNRSVGVAHVFCLGSTYSAQLCRRFGLNPDEQVKR